MNKTNIAPTLQKSYGSPKQKRKMIQLNKRKCRLKSKTLNSLEATDFPF